MPKILIVDDDENIRTMLQQVLDSEGFAVTTAGTVRDALALISQCKFDVLISDLNVGHPSDGFVIVSAMRRTHPEALTFILTGYPDFDSALEAIRQQCQRVHGQGNADRGHHREDQKRVGLREVQWATGQEQARARRR